MRCPKCNRKPFDSNNPKKRVYVYKFGSFYRKSDSRHIQRFRCRACSITFSHALKDPAYNQNKRKVNYQLLGLLASGISMRRAAKLLNISRTTVARKLIFLGKLTRDLQKKSFTQIKEDYIQFDELQTIEHTKCKPLSVAVAVSARNRRILGIQVSRMPATGYLAAISRKKYGYRPDQRRKGLQRLFEEIRDVISEKARFLSDEHPYYGDLIRKHFKKARHRQVKGAKSAVTGQGELKKKVKDPLFYINHTLAMLRANINRLIRKTWCTTKDPARLYDHLSIYTWFHNNRLLAKI